MRWFRRFVGVLFLLSGASAAWAQHAAPAVTYWHLWTGNDGRSHLTKCSMTSFVGKRADGQLQAKQPGSAKLMFAYNSKGDWHENPQVQWVVPLQGLFFIKAQDGSEVTLSPGELLLGEDLNTSPDAKGHKGHVSASKGKDPVVLLITQLDVPARVGEPCRFK